jgi:hypothetical protein
MAASVPAMESGAERAAFRLWFRVPQVSDAAWDFEKRFASSIFFGLAGSHAKKQVEEDESAGKSIGGLKPDSEAISPGTGAVEEAGSELSNESNPSRI